MKKEIITYNDGFGKMNAIAIGNQLIVKRVAYVRAWQKVSDYFGGLSSVIFDTNKEVIDQEGRVYKHK